jgi:hypothetical protein
MFGNAILIAMGVGANISRNIIAFNHGSTGALRINSGGSALFACNAFWNNSFGSVTGTYDSLDVDPNTIFADPLFCSISNDNYHVSACSPCDEEYSPCGLLIGCLPAICVIGIVGDGSPHSKWKNINKADNLPVNEAYKKAIDSESDYLNGAIETALPRRIIPLFSQPL